MDIQLVRTLCVKNKIRWTTHGAQRAIERGISSEDVLFCLSNGEIIEDYPDSFPLPSCLVLGKTLNGNALHIVVGTDFDSLKIVTAYFPTEEKFGKDLKTRKQEA